MAKAKALIITGNGTNCEMEAAHACRLGGFDEARIAHISDLLSGEIRLDDFHFLNLTGGFLDGDDLGSAKAQANRLRYAKTQGGNEHLFEQLQRFIDDGKLVLGVCNGFQLLVKMGLLPGFANNGRQQVATLTFNDSGRFQDRWVYLKNNTASNCIFTRGVEKGLYLPSGTGKVNLSWMARKRWSGSRKAILPCSFIPIQHIRLPPWNSPSIPTARSMPLLA